MLPILWVECNKIIGVYHMIPVYFADGSNDKRLLILCCYYGIVKNSLDV